MAVQSDSGGKDDVKTQFVTREGTYRLMALSEYSRPNRVGYSGGAGSSQVRVSLVTLPPAPAASPGAPAPAHDQPASDDRICFNHGKELYVYVYRGIKKAADLTKPVDKKIYKGTNPTCHDFNAVTATADSVSLVVGFSTGQIQLIDPIKKELNKLYNEERLIDKTRVTCIKWVPGSSNLFVAAHASGQLYVYNEELSAPPAPPHYQLFKAGAGYSVHTCRAKSTRNPLYRWVIGAEGGGGGGAGGTGGSCINELAFSPCGAHLALAAQDGLLRVFHYDTMELVGRARSYFGGFLCCCWSPDGRLVVVGGEDDLLTVWALAERRVVARAQGHRSWVSVVAFDPYVVSFGEAESEEGAGGGAGAAVGGGGAHCYRLGSVAQDTQLCLWDLTEDVLRPPVRARASAHLSPAPAPPVPAPAAEPNGVAGGAGGRGARGRLAHKHAELPAEARSKGALSISVGKAKEEGAVGSLTARLAGFSFGERRGEHRRHFSLSRAAEPKAPPAAGAGGSVALRGGAAGAGDASDALRLIGTPLCPRFDECPVLEPLVCKKIAHERLTALLFRADCLLTATADGAVSTWARPAHPPAPRRSAAPPAAPPPADREPGC